MPLLRAFLLAEWDDRSSLGHAFSRGSLMTWYQIAGDWQQFTAMVKEEWDKLTDDDLTTFGGQSDQLAGLLQKKYGYAARTGGQRNRRVLTETEMISSSLRPTGGGRK